MAVAFGFRQEYLEYLDIKDVNVQRTAVTEAQTITLNTQADPSCIVMLSISLLMYDQVGHTGEDVLLNNKGFSPSAIIAAYPAEQAAPKTAKSIILSIEAYPDRHMKMQEISLKSLRCVFLFQYLFLKLLNSIHIPSIEF